MIFWTTWMMGFILGCVCLVAALDCRRHQTFYLTGAYFSMASGVAMSLLGVAI